MSLLNLEELYKKQEHRHAKNRKVFEVILERCHKYIKNVNRQLNLLECYYTIPNIVFGYPPFKLEDAVKYVMSRLSRNGLLVLQTQPDMIYISWDPDNIDYEKYMKNRESLVSDEDNINIGIVPISSEMLPGNTNTKKGKAKRVPTKKIEIDNEFQDMIPVNEKKIR
jgi:hypothetical protein